MDLYFKSGQYFPKSAQRKSVKAEMSKAKKNPKQNQTKPNKQKQPKKT